MGKIGKLRFLRPERQERTGVNRQELMILLGEGENSRETRPSLPPEEPKGKTKPATVTN